jgi:hypothetical protein
MSGEREDVMKVLARAFPVLPGKEGSVRALAEEVLRERRFQADEFYRRMGIVRETWHLQQTDAGPMVIVCTELTDLEEATRAYAASQHPFDAWFKQQVRRLSDPTDQPAGPFSEQVFEWAEAAQVQPARG